MFGRFSVSGVLGVTFMLCVMWRFCGVGWVSVLFSGVCVLVCCFGGVCVVFVVLVVSLICLVWFVLRWFGMIVVLCYCLLV